jgi:deazaflavin-dependent oxidoreductase (nitroreductase family)
MTHYEPSRSKYVADHVERYLATDGADGAVFNGVPCIVLSTVGRKTGALRRCAVIRIKDGDRYLVVGSMGGAPKHPVWYLNLLADPDVTIQDRDEVHELRARPATGAERTALWAVATDVWPAYDDYQAKTDREIPLVICEPRA